MIRYSESPQYNSITRVPSSGQTYVARVCKMRDSGMAVQTDVLNIIGYVFQQGTKNIHITLG